MTERSPAKRIVIGSSTRASTGTAAGGSPRENAAGGAPPAAAGGGGGGGGRGRGGPQTRVQSPGPSGAGQGPVVRNLRGRGGRQLRAGSRDSLLANTPTAPHRQPPSKSPMHQRPRPSSPGARESESLNVAHLPLLEQVHHHLDKIGLGQGKADLYSLQCLVNIAARTEQHPQLLKANMVAPLTKLLAMHDEEVACAHAALALSNLARSEEFQEQIGRAGGVEFASPLLERSTHDVLSKAVMLLTNLSCSDTNFSLILAHQVVPRLLGVFEFASEELCNMAILLLQNITHLQEVQEAIVEAFGLRKIARCVQRLPASDNIVFNSAVIFAHISFHDALTAALVEQGVLPMMLRQLNSSDSVIKNHTIRTVTNIATIPECREALFDCGIVPSILECLEADSFELLEHSCMTLSSLSNKEAYANELLKFGGMPHIAKLLNSLNETLVSRAAKLVANLAVYESPRAKLQDLDLKAVLEEKGKSSNPTVRHYARIALQNLVVPVTKITAERLRRQSLGPVNTAQQVEKKEAAGNVPEEKREKYRVHRVKVVQEILETEKTYVANLISVVQFFMKPLQKLQERGSPLIPPVAYRDIFSSIEILCGMHTNFLQELEKSINEKKGDSPSDAGYEDEPKVGHVFVGLVDCLRMYNGYISNYDKSIDVLSVHLENSKFRDFVNTQETTYDTLKLSSILITPIQRIPRYSLLLQDLIRHMPSEHPDFQDLSTALKGVLEVADYLDVEKGKAEAVNKVLSIQENMSGLPYKLVEPHRTFVKSGDVIAEPSLKDTSMKYCHFFLFSDILVQAVQKGTKFRCKRVFELQYIKVLPLPAKTKPNSFRILTLEDGFTFTLSTEKEKEAWLETLNKCVYNYKKNSIQRRAASVMATNRQRASEVVVSQ